MEEQLSRQQARLNQNEKMLEDLYHNYAASLGLSDSALWILYIVWIQGDGCTQKEICDSWSYTKQTINSALNSLEKQGLIRRMPLADNRKSKQVVLTAEGRAFAQKAVLPMLEAETASLGRLSERERADLLALTEKRTKFLQIEMEKAIAALKKG